MLTIEFLNISKYGFRDRTDGVANYEVTVRVNGRIIATDVVMDHARAAGWPALVRRFALQAQENDVKREDVMGEA